MMAAYMMTMACQVLGSFHGSCCSFADLGLLSGQVLSNIKWIRRYFYN